MTSTDGVLAVARQTKRAAMVVQRALHSHSALLHFVSHPRIVQSRR
jgi:hypothetical protein